MFCPYFCQVVSLSCRSSLYSPDRSPSLAILFASMILQPNIKLYYAACTINSARTLQQFRFPIFPGNNPNRMRISQYWLSSIREDSTWPCLGYITHTWTDNSGQWHEHLVHLNSCSSPATTSPNWQRAHQKNPARGMQEYPSQTNTRAVIGHYRQTYHRKSLQIGR